MSSYAESGRAPRMLTEREQRLLLKVTGEHLDAQREAAVALGIVILPNLVALVLLAPRVADMTRDYFDRKPWQR
jgi:hypothetical protein